MKKYDRVMPRVYNRSRSSLKSTSFVTRHQTSPSSVIGAKPSVSNVSSGVFSDLPVVLNDYKLEPDKPARRPYVVKPRKTLKSLDPALSPLRSVRRSQECRPKVLMKSRGSAPCVLGPSDEKWPETHMRQCLSSRSHTRLKELKDEIKAYEEKGKMARLRSDLFQRCGVLLDEMGHPAEDKAVQVEVGKESTVKKKWKSLRTYFIRQARALEKTNNSKSTSDADNVVSYKYCLWPLYEKMAFLSEQAHLTRSQRVKLTDDDYKILDEMNDITLKENSDETEAMETIIYHVPNGDASPLEGDESDDCELVSDECQTSTAAASTSVASSSAILLSKVSSSSNTLIRDLGLSQYLPPPLKRIAPKVQSKPPLNQSNQKSKLTQEHPEFPAQQQQEHPKQQATIKDPKSQAQEIRKENPIPQEQQITKPKQQVTGEPMIYLAKQQPVQHTTQGQHTQQKIVVEALPQSLRPNLLQLFDSKPSMKTMLTATNPPPLCKIPPLKRARLSLNKEQNKDQLVKPTTTTHTNDGNEKNDADYQFFKSLLPFMKELPIKNRLRIRNSIQHLILKELEIIERDKKLARFPSKEVSRGDGPTILLDGPSGEDSNLETSVNVKEDVEIIECTDDLMETKTEIV